MRIQFTETREQIVDSWVRASKRSKVMRRQRRFLSVMAAFLAGLFVLVWFRLSIHGLIAAAGAALISVITDPWLFRYMQRKNLRKLVAETYGKQDQFVCQVELVPDGLKTNTSGFEVNFPWEAVAEIVETTGSVDILAGRAFCVVQNHAFSSAEERQRFIDLAREYKNKARAITRQ